MDATQNAKPGQKSEPEEYIAGILKELGAKLPRFGDGRIDYTTSKIAPVVTVYISYGGKILLFKRSDRVATYRGMWDAVSGYIDEPKAIKDKAVEEVTEETGINASDIERVEVGATFELKDDSIGKTWVVCPVHVALKREPAITLDFENTEYRWVYPRDIGKFSVLPGLDRGIAGFEI